MRRKYYTKTETVNAEIASALEKAPSKQGGTGNQSVRYIMFHYWKNSEAKPFALTAPTRLVNKTDIPDGYLLRQEKDATQFLLIQYDPYTPSTIRVYDILKVQRRGSNRYLPFVCTMENIQK